MEILKQLMYMFCTIYLWQIMLCVRGANGRQNNHHRASSSSHYRNGRTDIDIKDKILELQCFARCEQSDLLNCLEQCKLDVMKNQRNGYCPNVQNAIFQNISPLQKLSCLDNCHYDFDCPVVQKCCQSTCGPVCMEPIGVRDDSELPPIPKIFLKSDLPKGPRGHKVEITIESSANSTYYCHVESRYHIGLLFSPRKLGMWQWQRVQKSAETSDKKSKRTDISFDLKPGRWYQVRVAAINAKGFRGYSDPSEAFTLSNKSKPPKPPVDLKVASMKFNGKYCNVKIVWCPSKSNLPIEKYKIIWSLYVKSKDASLISNEAYVKDRHQFEISKLLSDSSYYIQVQAMSISGKRRLKSEKFSILFNTTVPTTTNQYSYTPLKCGSNREEFSNNHNIGNGNIIAEENTNITNDIRNATTTLDNTKTVVSYEVRFRLNRKFGMIVLITGFQPHKEKVYELCPKDTNCEQREYSAIRVKKDSLEFSKLKYNTTYMLKAFRTNDVEETDVTGSFTFTTPKCENFRKRFPKMQIKC